MQRLAEETFTQLLISCCTDAYYKDDVVTELERGDLQVTEFYTNRIAHTNYNTNGLPASVMTNWLFPPSV
jgi:hypothetical protein